MKISLILATKGRVEEVERFLLSLMRQQISAIYELVIVDQNEDDRLKPVLNRIGPGFPVIRLRSETGLSRARNMGVKIAKGEIIGFPDDDCWYPDGLLARVVSEISSRPLVDGLTGRSEDGRGGVSGGSFSHRKGRVGLSNVWKTGISYTIFLRSAVCASVGEFDESLGVGAKTRFGSGEESDYLIRAVKLGFNIQYEPDLVVYHPNKILYNKNDCSKAFRYGAGMGRVLTKHRYKLSYILYKVLRPIGGVILSLITLRTAKAGYHLAIAKGRICGLLS